MRFHPRTPSSGWKNCVSVWISPRRSRGWSAEPHLVERADRQRVQQRFRHHFGALAISRGANSRAWRTLLRRQLVERRVVAACQHRPAELPPLREAVDPRDGVPVAVVAVEHARHAVVDVCGSFGVDGHVRGLDRLQLQRRLGDDPGEPHAARGRPERVGVGVRVDGDRAVRGGDELHPLDGVAEAAEPELAVDVGGDRAADGDVAGAGHDHREPAERDERAHQHVEAHARPRPCTVPSARRARARGPCR